MAKAHFQQPVFQSSVSRYPSEIIQICRFAQEIFLTVMLITAVLFNDIVETVIQT